MNTHLVRFIILFSLGVLLILLITLPVQPVHSASFRPDTAAAPFTPDKPVSTLTTAEINVLAIQAALIPPTFYADLPVVDK